MSDTFANNLEYRGNATNQEISRSLGPYLRQIGFVEVSAVPDPELWANRFVRSKHGIEAGIAVIEDQEFIVRVVQLDKGYFESEKRKCDDAHSIDVRQAGHVIGIKNVPPREFIRTPADRTRIREFVPQWIPVIQQVLDALIRQNRIE